MRPWLLPVGLTVAGLCAVSACDEPFQGTAAGGAGGGATTASSTNAGGTGGGGGTGGATCTDFSDNTPCAATTDCHAQCDAGSADVVGACMATSRTQQTDGECATFSGCLQPGPGTILDTTIDDSELVALTHEVGTDGVERLRIQRYDNAAGCATSSKASVEVVSFVGGPVQVSARIRVFGGRTYVAWASNQSGMVEGVATKPDNCQLVQVPEGTAPKLTIASVELECEPMGLRDLLVQTGNNSTEHNVFLAADLPNAAGSALWVVMVDPVTEQLVRNVTLTGGKLWDLSDAGAGQVNAAGTSTNCDQMRGYAGTTEFPMMSGGVGQVSCAFVWEQTSPTAWGSGSVSAVAETEIAQTRLQALPSGDRIHMVETQTEVVLRRNAPTPWLTKLEGQFYVAGMDQIDNELVIAGQTTSDVMILTGNDAGYAAVRLDSSPNAVVVMTFDVATGVPLNTTSFPVTPGTVPRLKSMSLFKNVERNLYLGVFSREDAVYWGAPQKPTGFNLLYGMALPLPAAN